jgi:uncharacterized protein YcnI
MTPKAGLAAVAVTLALGAAAPALAGSIAVIHMSFPKDAQDFTYTVGPTAALKLDDDVDNALSNKVAMTLPAGTWGIRAYPSPPGWALKSITCAGSADARVLANGRMVTVNLLDDTSTLCTVVQMKVAP